MSAAPVLDDARPEGMPPTTRSPSSATSSFASAAALKPKTLGPVAAAAVDSPVFDLTREFWPSLPPVPVSVSQPAATRRPSLSTVPAPPAAPAPAPATPSAAAQRQSTAVEVKAKDEAMAAFRTSIQGTADQATRICKQYPAWLPTLGPHIQTMHAVYQQYKAHEQSRQAVQSSVDVASSTLTKTLQARAALEAQYKESLREEAAAQNSLRDQLQQLLNTDHATQHAHNQCLQAAWMLENVSLQVVAAAAAGGGGAASGMTGASMTGASMTGASKASSPAAPSGTASLSNRDADAVYLGPIGPVPAAGLIGPPNKRPSPPSPSRGLRPIGRSKPKETVLLDFLIECRLSDPQRLQSAMLTHGIDCFTLPFLLADDQAFLGVSQPDWQRLVPYFLRCGASPDIKRNDRCLPDVLAQGQALIGRAKACPTLPALIGTVGLSRMEPILIEESALDLETFASLTHQEVEMFQQPIGVTRKLQYLVDGLRPPPRSIHQHTSH